MSHEKSKAAARFTAGLLGAVLALQSVFVGMLISHIQDRGIHHDQQYVTLAAYQADREHFGRSLEEIKLALRDIQKRLAKNQATAGEHSGLLGFSLWQSQILSPPRRALLPKLRLPRRPDKSGLLAMTERAFLCHCERSEAISNTGYWVWQQARRQGARPKAATSRSLDSSLATLRSSFRYVARVAGMTPIRGCPFFLSPLRRQGSRQRWLSVEQFF